MSDRPPAATSGTASRQGAHRRRHAASARRRHSLVRIAGCVAAVLSVALLCGFGYGWYQYRSLTGNLQRLALPSLGHGHDAHPAGTEMNILVTGVDSRDGLSESDIRLLHTGHDASTSTDTVMIIHVPADGSNATIISIPRDSFVDIPDGWATNKINAAYANGSTVGATARERQNNGADLLVRTVENLTGLQIDHYVQVGFGGFYTIAKAIGGIPVTLCHAVDDSIAANENAGLDRTGSGFVMPAGHHDLTPVQAFEFVRQRHFLPGGDLARERRQQYFLAAAFAKMASGGVLLNPAKLGRLIDAVDGALYLDDGLADNLTTLAKQLVDLSAGNIRGYTIPTEGAATRTIAGVPQDVVLVERAAVRARVAQLVSGHTAPTSSSTTTTSPSTSTSSPSARTPAAPTSQKCID